MILSGISTSAADTLVVSLQVSNYNGYQVSCFGSKDGWIDLSVSGGQPPYHYEWSNGSNDQDLTELAAGYYKVDVLDNDGQRVTKEVTLDQPLAMKLDVDVYEYSNGYNISCYQCSNGNASVVVLGGAPPFTITWSDGPIGADRYNLAAKDYKITAADANGCAGTSTTIYLRGPDRSDWSMSGNAGTTPGPQYIGTPDNKDVVLKSNGQERLRLLGNGDIRLWGADTTVGPLYRDFDGTLKIGGGPITPHGCFLLNAMPYWQTRGNDFTQLCPDEPLPVLGTLSNDNLPIYTNNVERMRITTAGRVGIGTTNPAQKFDVHHTDVRGGIQLSNDLTGNAHSEIRFSQGSNERWGLGCDLAAVGDQDFFLWDEPSGAIRFYVNEDGKVGMGTTEPKGNLHVRSPGPTKAVVSASTATNAETWVYNSEFGYGLRVDPNGMGRIMYDFNAPLTAISITKEGKVGIGVDPPLSNSLYKLYVDEGIVCRDVKVTTEDPFPDYVFAPEYALMPLDELRKHLREHRHLPGIPSAAQVKENDGVEVGDLQVRMLKVVEDQALYILELQEQVDVLKAQVQKLSDAKR